MLTTLASPALASPREEASALMRQGGQRFSQGDYAGALAAFRKANALFPSHRIDFNIAAALSALGKNAEAAAHYQRFLARADEAKAREQVALAREQLALLGRSLGVVRLRGALDGAVVTIDDRPLEAEAMGQDLYLDPGLHTVKATRPDMQDIHEKLSLVAGEVQELALVWQPAPRPAPTPAAPPSATGSEPASDRARRPASSTEPSDRGHPRRTWAFVALGTGLALWAGAGVLYGLGSIQGNEAHDRYLAASTEVMANAQAHDVRTARTRLIGGHVLAGAGLGVLGVSLYLFLTQPRDPEATPPMAIGPSLWPGGAALSASGAF